MTYLKATEEFKATHPPAEKQDEEQHHDGYIHRIKESKWNNMLNRKIENFQNIY